jgi:hypothetical protein
MVERMSPESGPRVVTCQRCGFVALQVSTVMEAAERAVEHLTAAGCPSDAVLIHPLAVARR